MSVTAFLSDIIPTIGYPVAAKVLSAKIQHQVRDNITELVAAGMQLDQRGEDAYFCVGTLIEKRKYQFNADGTPLMADGGNGQQYHKYVVRTAANISHVKVLHLDVDVHVSGFKRGVAVYPSTLAALTDMKRIATELSFPKPSVVASGSGGLHVYWLIAEDVPRDTWRALAAKWRLVIDKIAPLIADKFVLEDCTRVYRLPGTKRHADGTLRDVTIITRGTPAPVDSYQQWLDAAVARLNINVPPPAMPAHLAALGSNIPAKDFPPLDFVTLAGQCQAFKYGFDNQASANEPVWRAMLMTARLCTDKDAVHWVSMKHPDYDHGATERKVASITATGAATCQLFDQLLGKCGGCAHRGKVNSPASVSHAVIHAPAPVQTVSTPAGPVQVTLPNPPHPYARTAQGTIVMQGKDENGNPTVEKVCDYDMYPTHRIGDKSNDDEYTIWQVHYPVKGWESAEFMASCFYDTKKLHGALLRKGVYVMPGDVRKVHSFMVAYLKHLQKQAKEDKRYAKLGWQDEGETFVLNGRVSTPTGPATPSAASEAFTVVRGIGTGGSLQGWKDAMRFYDDPRYVAHQFCCLASFAAPLMKFTGFAGVVLNMDGRPGAGKTTVLHAVNSVWGNSNELMLSGGKAGSTVTGRYQKLSAHNNLPVTLDEITTLSGEEASALVHAGSQGMGKQRAKGYGDMETWCTILETTSNGSLYHKISTFKEDAAGENVRIFEIYMDNMQVHTKAEADEFNYQLRQNYGWAGQLYADTLVKNRAKLPDLVRSFMLDVDARAHVESGERFRAALVAVVGAAGGIVKRLGLVGWDIDAVVEWGVQHMSSLREVTAAYHATAMDTLGDFLDTHLNDTLTLINASKALSGTADILREPRGKLLVRHEMDTGTLFIQAKSFKTYCSTAGADFRQIQQELQALGVLVAVDRLKSLGSHTTLEKSPSRCWVIDMTNPLVSRKLVAVTSPPMQMPIGQKSTP